MDETLLHFDAGLAVAQEMVVTYGLSVIGAILILIVGWALSRWLSRATEKALSRFKKLDDTLKPFFASLVRYLVLAITVVAVFDEFGVKTTSFVAVLGAAGLAIGLALQGTLSNVAAGVMLLLFRPYKVGDYIQAGSLSGTVKSLSLFLTELATPDNVQITVPNGELWNKAITNYSTNPTRRLGIPVGISYSDDIGQALEVLLRVAQADSRVLGDPAPQTMVTDLGDSSVNIQARVWVKATDYWALKWAMTRAVKESLDDAGITIPFPQREVHLVPQKPDSA
ncbi:mechanosensitive ion channel family protein [Roseospirillum parvum]|uniref:Small-conductance mechanosensitive channel n=1 Tax=Roseospirillum parvum TaxID=83401 RepID=A0A1G8AS41_9PROT|nr:mechanosensitive ion channel domain-containing protein [Roseospirillum parvum]SDH23821.1 small conductance mechanosensitive channel [Roseospirillum parvum]